MNSFLHPSEDNSQEKAYQFIKEAILGFQLKPNQRLVASEIAAGLDISRTPVREALSRLEQEGLVMRTGGWGYLVRAMNLRDVLDLFKVREALETEAIAEAMPNIDRSTIEQLGKVLEKSRGSKEQFGKFVAWNRTFHNMIATATRNEILRYMLSIISDRVQMIGAMTMLHHAERANEILGENYKILNALEKKDSAAAKAAVRAHIRRGRDYAVQIFEQSGERFVFATTA